MFSAVDVFAKGLRIKRSMEPQVGKNGQICLDEVPKRIRDIFRRAMIESLQEEFFLNGFDTNILYGYYVKKGKENGAKEKVEITDNLRRVMEALPELRPDESYVFISESYMCFKMNHGGGYEPQMNCPMSPWIRKELIC